MLNKIFNFFRSLSFGDWATIISVIIGVVGLFQSKLSPNSLVYVFGFYILLLAVRKQKRS